MNAIDIINKTPKEALGVFRKKEVSLKSKESRLDR